MDYKFHFCPGSQTDSINGATWQISLASFQEILKKRIDIAGGYLLLFIAFNFMISNDPPRLSYLTFMDAILFNAFVIRSLSVIVNVILRRMELGGRAGLANRIDQIIIWAYIPVYVGAVFAAYLIFFQIVEE
ncbi:MAG: hypothetical protein U9R74_17755 [Pseudomonadota bacterium]|nr:hypothetical protein [Pseudomonadota bacterium]